MNPYPDWLSSGDNAWQLVAATLVGLMSIPGIAVLYGGLVQKKWAVNTMLMAFTGFSLVLVAWVLWEFKMGFGQPLKLGPGILQSAVGKPASILGADNQHQASIPLLDAGMPKFRFSETTLAYFQFVFAAITPLLFLGSVVGRMNFKVWLLFVPLWSTIAYAVNAFLLWGGGWWAQPHPGLGNWAITGALDFSGGYVIHLAAGTTGFVAAAVIGPRLARDRERAVPNNLPMAAVGAGILWLGWNGFNGGDPYFSGSDASEAVLNTNLATGVALLTWVLWDMFASKQRKPTFLGAVNGMIAGLVAITPGAGYVDGWGAIAIGVCAGIIPWLSMNKFQKCGFMMKVDDTLSVFSTHGVAGLMGGLLVGVFANPDMLQYIGTDKEAPGINITGLLYGNAPQLLLQVYGAAFIIVYNVIATYIILKVIGFIVPLRMDEATLKVGDDAVHGETAYAIGTEGE